MFNINNMMNLQSDKRIIDYYALALIGLMSLSYILWGRDFAELHISLPLLPFPVFIGEILLFICWFLFFLKYRFVFKSLNRWQWLAVAYSIFVLFKASIGYFQWGPLALRHSALFYYPSFFIFGYAFYRREFFSNKKNVLLALLLILIPRFIPFYDYYFLTCFILALVLIKAYPNKITRYILFLSLLIFTPYKLFFQTSRTMLVGNLVTGIYMIPSLFFVLKIKKNYRIIISTALMIFMLAGVLKIEDINAAKSIVDFKNLMGLYDKYNKVAIERQDSFKMREIRTVKLYNPELAPIDKVQVEIREVQAEIRKVQSKIEAAQSQIDEAQLKTEEIQLTKRPQSQTEIKEVQSKIEEAQSQIEVAQFQIKQLQSQAREKQSQVRGKQFKIARKAQSQEEIQSQVQQGPRRRSLEGAHIKALFRIFIWRDMFVEMIKEKPIFGFDFGKPLRSRSLEILGWGEIDWQRDGWIGVHNSWVHIIYRAGVVGVTFIVFVFSLLIKMIIFYVKQRSFVGICLCAIAVNWFMAANFLLILELPYTAIPIWSIFGLNYAYYKSLENRLGVSQEGI